jgi:hypothetical protein
MGSAASPSRYSGRPEAGHDSRDARLHRSEKCTFTVCERFLAGITIGSGKRRALLIPPSWSSPAFLLPAPAVLALSDRLDAGLHAGVNFAQTAFSELSEVGRTRASRDEQVIACVCYAHMPFGRRSPPRTALIWG